MRKNIFLALLLLAIYALSAFSATNIVTPLSTGYPSAEYEPGKVLVKFKSSVNVSPYQLDSAAPDAAKLTNFTSVNGIFSRHKLVRIKKTLPVFDTQKIKQKFKKRTFRASRKAQMPDISNIHTLTFDKTADVKTIIEELKKDPNVEYAEPNYKMHLFSVPNDTYYNTSGSWGQPYKDMWGLHRISAEAAWDICTGSSEIVVAVVDTGVDYTHEDLSANIWTNSEEIPGNGIDDDSNGFVDDVIGWNFAANNNDPMDDHVGHGTHCSGTIAGVGNNGKGVVGVTWSCKIMPVKAFGGSDTLTNLLAAMAYAANNGADVISNSWGGPHSDLTADMVNYCHAMGCVVVAAAGNYNSDSSFYSPAGVPAAITVAAVDHNDIKTDFSCWGNVIDVAAPGGESGNYMPPDELWDSLKVSILSLRAGSTDMYLGSDGYTAGDASLGGVYYRAAGTSMACPHVAGLAALILSNNPDITNDEVADIICSSADDLGAAGFDIYYGYGRINAYRALLTDPFKPPVIEQNPRDGDGNYTVSWYGASHESGIACYELQEGEMITYGNIFADTFEAGIGQWNCVGFGTSDAKAYNGSLSAFSGSGNDLDNSMTSASPIFLTRNAPELRFFCSYDLQTWDDWVFLEVSTNGTDWTPLDGYTGSTSSWAYQTYDLSAFVGKSIYLRFRLKTGSSSTTSGFYVDDISISDRDPALATISSSITDTHYHVTGHIGGNYRYRVRAKNNLGRWSAWSKEMIVVAMLDDGVPPTTPAFQPLPPDSDGNYRLSWSGATDESGISCYELRGSRLDLFDDVENSTGIWSLSGFSRSSAKHNSGDHSYYSGTGNDLSAILNSVSSYEITSPLAAINFWCSYNTEHGFDGTYVEVSTDNVSWDTLDYLTGAQSSWRNKTYSLGSYVGQRVYVRFRYETDYSIYYEGFSVDDISIGNWDTMEASLTETYYDVSGNPAGYYGYVVRAKDPHNNWSSSSSTCVVQVTPETSPPSTPQLAPIGNKYVNDFTVSWGGSTHEGGIAAYELQESSGLVPTFEDGAEDGTGKWLCSGFVGTNYISYSGQKSFYSGFGNNMNNYLVMNSPISIMSSNEVLRFRCWYDVENGADYAYVDISTNGVVYTTIEAITGSSAGWIEKAYDLSSYTGSSVYVRFRYVTNSSGSYFGFCVDDIYICPAYSWSTLSSSLAETSYSMVKPPGYYAYRVRAKDNNNRWSDWSNIESANVFSTGYTFHDTLTGITVFVPFSSSSIEPTITIEVIAEKNEELPGPPPTGRALNGKSVDIVSDIPQFTGPVYITMPFTGSNADPKPYFWDGSYWKESGITVTDRTSNSITFSTPHLSIFGIFIPQSNSLNGVRVYPNPYSIDEPPGGVVFDNLSGNEVIRIYTISGALVRKEEVTGTAWTWDVSNNSGRQCAQGIYVFMISKPNGTKRTGKIAITD